MVVLISIIAALYLSGWIFTIAQAGSDIVAMYFFAWLLQFFFTPTVDYLSRRVGLPRVLSVSLVYVAVGAAVAGLLIVTVPALYSQGERLAKELGNPKTYHVISNATRGIEHFAETRLHVPHSQIQAFTKNYGVNLQGGAIKAGTKLQQIINSRLTPANLSNSATAFLNFLGVLNTLLLNLVIVLILAFYMMLDGHKLVRRALAYFPPAVDEAMESVHQIINRKFGGYIRSQVILSLSFGILTYAVSQGFNLHYSVIISAAAAILMLLPFIGAFLSVVPPLVGFLLVHVTDTSFPLVRFVVLLIFLAVMQHVVLNLLAPRVMSSTIGMHPLLVMLGLLLGARLGGLWGAIFGVPVLGVLLDTTDLIYRRVMDRRYGFHPVEVKDEDDKPPPRSPRKRPVVFRPRRRARVSAPVAGAGTARPSMQSVLPWPAQARADDRESAAPATGATGATGVETRNKRQ